MTRRARNASVRSFVSKSKIAGSVIAGGPLGIKTICGRGGGFPVIFFMSIVLNELAIIFRLDMYLGACKSSVQSYWFEGFCLVGKVFVHIAFLKNRRENEGKMNLVQPAGCFESSPSVSGGHQVDGLPPARSQNIGAGREVRRTSSWR